MDANTTINGSSNFRERARALLDDVYHAPFCKARHDQVTVPHGPCECGVDRAINLVSAELSRLEAERALKLRGDSEDAVELTMDELRIIRDALNDSDFEETLRVLRKLEDMS